MSYPYQPPHQPGYPAPGPGYPAPAYAAAPGPYGYPQPAPSGGTGITAGILALLGALSSIGMAISMFILTAATSESSLTSGAALATGARRRSSSSSSSGTDVDIDFEGVGIIWGILYLIVAVALLVGGIMLLKRSSAGRTTVIVACVAFLIVSIFGFGITAIIAGLFALGTLVLAALGSTKRWIEAGRAPAMAGGYGPAPYGY
ncbi:hypothetical protein [Nocardia flavorosea]|uniref:Uncharacterized protein n=1 Tax=Nocardia flavorosea TaxID=53429 RepID=A0A846YEF3_9NOCA|nr:hypothetical protein [Nocardia flavorosea]NKY56231.1 hypothetical protein [Nocardia flavorosea]